MLRAVITVFLASATLGVWGATAPRASTAPRVSVSGERVSASRPSTARGACLDGTNSTPGCFVLPQMGTIGFRCDRAFRAAPFVDTRGALATEEVTIRAGKVMRSNFRRRIVGRYRGRLLRADTVSSAPVLGLPFGHYGIVTFALSTGDEARGLKATVTAEFLAGVSQRPAQPRLGACYVRRWLVSMNVNTW